MDLLSRDTAFAALSSALSFAGRRQTLIADNIANVNTPNYKRRDLDSAAFNAQLSAALAQGGTNTDPESVARRAQRAGSIDSRQIVEESLFYRVDMGGVDIDREMAELAKTSLLGSAMGQLLQKRIGMYRLVIREGR